MDVFIVSGFLGAGKTTLIKHLLTSNIQGMGKVALIVNELGNLGIDGTLLSGKNVDMMEITSGCICCTLKTDFSRAVQEIHDRVSPDSLVVEATGVAQPGDILDTLYEPPANEFSRIRHLVTVVDAEFFKAKDMFGPFYDNQIRCADTILLNKIDLIPPESVSDIQVSLQEMNPRAKIFATQHCAVNPQHLLMVEPTHMQGADHAYHGIAHYGHDHPDEGGFQAFSFDEERPFDRGKLEAFLQSLPPNLFRLKGWVRFPDFYAVINFTAGRYSIAPWEQPKKTALAMVGYNCDESEILEGLKACIIEEPNGL
ncbi:MAG: GTP-binding protein [Desulfobacteraceae bacterium]|jgi:G3E family GTPase